MATGMTYGRLEQGMFMAAGGKHSILDILILDPKY